MKLFQPFSSVATLAVAALVVGSLGGCAYILPSRPAEDRIEMTIRSSEVWFRWCGPATEHHNLRISFDEKSGDGATKKAYEGAGWFDLDAGDEFAVSAPPGGLTPTTPSQPIPVSDELDHIFVTSNLRVESPDRSASSARDDGDGKVPDRGIAAVFRVADAGRLDGVWVRADGRTSQAPCSGDTGG